MKEAAVVLKESHAKLAFLTMDPHDLYSLKVTEDVEIRRPPAVQVVTSFGATYTPSPFSPSSFLFPNACGPGPLSLKLKTFVHASGNIDPSNCHATLENNTIDFPSNENITEKHLWTRLCFLIFKNSSLKLLTFV